MHKVPEEERLTPQEVLNAWNRALATCAAFEICKIYPCQTSVMDIISGDVANKDIADTQYVEDKRTGKMENKQSVWVRTGGMKKDNFELQQETRTGSKSFVTKDTSAAALQAIEKRARGFAPSLQSMLPCHATLAWRLHALVFGSLGL